MNKINEWLYALPGFILVLFVWGTIIAVVSILTVILLPVSYVLDAIMKENK